MFFRTGDIWPIDEPPIMKQKNVPTTTPASFALLMTSHFENQNPREYTPKKISMTNAKDIAPTNISFLVFSLPLSKLFKKTISSKASPTKLLIVLIPPKA